MNKPLVVTGHLIAKPGKEQLLMTVLVAQLARVHSQPGNLYADLVQNRDAPTEFLLYEIWKSEEDLAWDLRQEYTQEVFRQLEELLVQPILVCKHFLVTTKGVSII
jgi:quinol monooxygenase YgiN